MANRRDVRLILSTSLVCVVSALRVSTPTRICTQHRRRVECHSDRGIVPDALPFDPYAGGAPPPDDILSQGLSRFLTQRAVQQQLYYFGLNLDETGSNWLSEFLRPNENSRIHEDYHGINALPTSTSSAFFGPMLATPEIEVQVRKPMGCAAGRGHGGINGATGLPITRNQNPYLKPRYFEYQEVIRPLAVATDIMVIREQISTEITTDLEFLVAEGKFLMATLGDKDSDVSPQSIFGNLDGFMPSDQHSENGRSSPYRLANYDLIKLLATKDALIQIASDETGSMARTARQFLTDHTDEINGHNIWVRHNSWVKDREGELCVTDGLLVKALRTDRGAVFVRKVVDQRTEA